jgi:hypothetical protein
MVCAVSRFGFRFCGLGPVLGSGLGLCSALALWFAQFVDCLGLARSGGCGAVGLGFRAP